MPAALTAAPDQSYAAVFAEARIAALHALTDILATSDDPVERRHAATTILRLPHPEPNPTPLAPPARSREAPPPQRRQTPPELPAHAPEPPKPHAAPRDPPPHELEHTFLSSVLSGELDIHRSNGIDLNLDEPLAVVSFPPT